MASVKSPRVALFDRILSHRIRPFLKDASFTKSGAEFQRRRGSLVDCLQFQRDRHDLPRELSLTVNCGIYVLGARAVWLDAYLDERPAEVRASVRDRIGMICGDGRDVWWRLRVRAGDRKCAAVADDIVGRLRERVLPWFDLFRSPVDVGDYLVDPAPGPGRTRFGYREVVQSADDLCEAAACYVVGGRADLAGEWLDVAIEGGKPQWRRDMARKLKARIGQLAEEGRLPGRPGDLPDARAETE